MAPPRPCQTLVGGTWAQSRRRAQPGPGRGAAPGPRSASGSSLSRPLPRGVGVGGPPHRTAAAGAVPTASDEGFVTRRAWPTVVLRATPVRAPHFSPGRAAGVCGLPGASGTCRRLSRGFGSVDSRPFGPSQITFAQRQSNTHVADNRFPRGSAFCPLRRVQTRTQHVLLLERALVLRITFIYKWLQYHKITR